MPRNVIKDVIADNDGTQVAFHHWFGPAMLSVVPQLAATMGVSVDDFGLALGTNMIAHRTHETCFPFGGPFFAKHWKGTHAEFVERITEPYFRAVDDYRRRYLHVYPGVHQVLEQASALGVRFHVLSDAPLYATLHKFCVLGWQNRFAGIYAIGMQEPPAADVWNPLDLEFCYSYLQRHLSVASQFACTRIVGLPRHAEKPGIAGIDMMIADQRINCARALVIGDSHGKDGGVAEAKNIGFIYARYGANDFAPPQYMEVVNHLLNPNRGKPFSWDAPKKLPAVLATVATYDGILPFLKRRASRRTTKTSRVA